MTLSPATGLIVRQGMPNIMNLRHDVKCGRLIESSKDTEEPESCRSIPARSYSWPFDIVLKKIRIAFAAKKNAKGRRAKADLVGAVSRCPSSQAAFVLMQALLPWFTLWARADYVCPTESLCSAVQVNLLKFKECLVQLKQRTISGIKI